jgi:hypothetical protein
LTATFTTTLRRSFATVIGAWASSGKKTMNVPGACGIQIFGTSENSWKSFLLSYPPSFAEHSWTGFQPISSKPEIE